MLASRSGECGRLIGERRVNVGHLAQEDLPDLRSVAVDRRDQDVGRLVVTQLHDQLRQISFKRGDPSSFQGLVEADFLGGHGFDLDHLIHAFAADEINDDLVGLRRVPGPMHHSTAGGDRGFQLDKVIRQVRHGVDLELATRFPQPLPVRQLRHDLRALASDGRCRFAEVAPQLGVGEGSPGGDRELLIAPQVANAAWCSRRHMRSEQSKPPNSAVLSLSKGQGAFTGRVHSTIAFSRVAARICARCTVLAPARSRDRPPPMCIRQELSPAVQISAPVSRTLRILSASMAVEVSEFLIANVPPKPQH